MFSRVLISGYFGFGNLGDEAILEAVVRELRLRDPEVAIVVPAGPDRSHIERLALEAIDFFSLEQLAAEIPMCELVLFGLGGVFQDYWGADSSMLFQQGTNGIEAYVRPALLAAMHGVPAVLFSAGIGPLRTQAGRAMFAAAARAATKLIVRDEGSAAEVVSIMPEASPIVSADAAFVLKATDADRDAMRNVLGERNLNDVPLAVVALRGWEFQYSDAQVASFVASALETLPEGWRIIFVPFHQGSGTNDRAIADNTIALLNRHAEVLEVKTPSEAIALFETAKLVIAARNHAVVFAGIAGAPVVSLAYDPKVVSSAAHSGGAQWVVPFGAMAQLADVMRDAVAASAHGPKIEAAKASARAGFEIIASDQRRRNLTRESDPEAAAMNRELHTLRLQLGEKKKYISALGEEVSKRDALLASQQQEFFADVTARDEQIARMVAEHETARAEADSLREAYGELQKQLLEVSGALGETTRQYDGAVTLIEQRTAERDRLEQQLSTMVRTKVWKVASAYWKVRQKFSRGDVSPPIEVAAPVPHATQSLVGEARAARDSGPKAPVLVENRFDVICFPIIDWDFRFQRPQQLMSQFAAAGHRVFYLRQKFRLTGAAYELRRVAENIYEVSLRGPDRNVYTDRLSSAEASHLFDSIDVLRREQQLGATTSIVQLPFWTPLAERARDRFAWPLIYDCMDHHAGFTTNTDAMLDEEARLLRTSDLVVVSSTFLEVEARKHNSRVVIVRNGCDLEHFARVGDIAQGRPVIGYYGAIADWFDADLVADLARNRPDWDFLLVGSTFTADVSRLSRLSNITLAGEKPYAEIPSWLERMNVCLIPFKRIPLTEATNPVKAYEMLAAGKPVVSVPIPEVLPLAPLVRLASTVPEFAREIEAALEENNDTLRGKRRTFARDHTWRARYDIMFPAVSKSFPKASVIIVTYNNVDLNRLCLDSLFDRNEWPNLEVFAVDNASSDATPAYLRDAQTQFRDLTVILNDDNRGFAAANNQALDLATGEYLILLNNDTVSPRGSIAALIRHLRSDKSIGLIGPSTNAIGNEGMIEVSYKNVADMPRFAADYMERNDGKTFDIPMLAMFCVAMRRDVFEEIGKLDENFGLGMYEDDDYAHRMKLAGYRVVCARDAFVHHWMKAAFGKIPTPEYNKLFEKNRAYYEQKWGTKWTPHQSA